MTQGPKHEAIKPVDLNRRCRNFCIIIHTVEKMTSRAHM
jgi:hypothetical protein